MSRKLTLQRAGPEHASALTAIAFAAKRHWGYPERWIELWAPQLTITPEYVRANETWLAALNEEPAAFYALREEGTTVWLDHLWVKPEAMGQGLGAFLFRHAMRRCRARGASTLQIESDPNAQDFYVKMGARKVGERHGEVDGQARVLPIMEIEVN
ncbi:MAG: GNAT family N-acetyltransferase [Chloroflexota bacterium]